MTHLVVLGASVEGEKLKLQTRQFYPYPPKRDPKTQRKRFGFKMGINSEAEIAEAYPDPAAVCTYLTSLFVAGDKISGQAIVGWALSPLGPPHVSKGSGSHSATFVSISGGCWSRIEVPARHHSASAQFQAENPPITPVLRVA